MKTVYLLIFACLFGISSFAQDYKGSAASSYEEKLNEEYCTGLFQSTHGTIIDVASQSSSMAYLNILDWLQGRISGLQVYRNRFGTSIPVIRGGVPGVFIDEIQVSPATLNSINMMDIAIVKVIKTPFYGGFNSGNGAIAIYTRGGEEDEEENIDD